MGSNEDNAIATPLVEDKIEEPKVGKLFNSVDEINNFYLNYGKKIGFAIHKRSCRKGDNGEVKYMTITCAREGKTRNTSNKPNYFKSISKTDCRARISSTLCPDGKWAITSVVLDHNHELNPNRSEFYRIKRLKQKRRFESDEETNIQAITSINSPLAEAEVHENLLFKSLWFGEGDRIALSNYFCKMQVNNSGFFYTIDLDNDGHLRNLFWADARSMAAYKVFGDVVTFDTRYVVKKYRLPLVLFLGSNHHGQLVLFGCGLISCDDVNTYTWLFKSLLGCMHNIPPKRIITDKDKAIETAIEIVFPNAQHRWCLWYVMEKLDEMMKSHEHYDSIKSCFEIAVYYSFTSMEFEEKWRAVITAYNLERDEFLYGLYEERNRWVPIFVKSSFWAGMSIDSIVKQNERLNSFFDGYVDSKSSIRKFMDQYENALKSKVEEEYEQDLKSLNSSAPCITHFDIEKQIQNTYTSAKFKEFQQELMGKIYCGLLSCVEFVGFTNYDIYEDVFIGEEIRRVIFRVCFSADVQEVDCSCGLFNFNGILCRHAITVLTHRRIRQIPDKYILERWSKNVKRAHTKVKICYDDWSKKPERRRFEEMCNAFKEVVDKVGGSRDRYNKVMTLIEELPRILETDSCGSNQIISKDK